MRTINFSLNLHSTIKTVGATVLGGLWALEWAWHAAGTKTALRKKLRYLHAIFQYPSSYSFRDLSVHPDRQADGQTNMARPPSRSE